MKFNDLPEQMKDKIQSLYQDTDLNFEVEGIPQDNEFINYVNDNRFTEAEIDSDEYLIWIMNKCQDITKKQFQIINLIHRMWETYLKHESSR